jgi:hypothetical protein
VLRFYARDFVKLFEELEELKQQLSVLGKIRIPQKITVPKLQELLHLLTKIESHCKPLDLTYSIRQIARIENSLQRGGYTLPNVCQMLIALRERVDDELAARIFFSVETHDLYLFRVTEIPGRMELKLPRELFGDEVVGSFPSSLRDIEDASKTLAYGQGTACVFHLMRVLECGLRALAVSLNDSRINPKTNPSWENILSKCDEELQKPLAKRSAEWKTDEPFFSSATANLRAVKDAWRNPTMHVEIFYDPEMAKDVWHSSRAFMRHLATKLRE